MIIYLMNEKELRAVEDPFVADNLLRKGWQRAPQKPSDEYEWSTEKGCWVKIDKPAVEVDAATIAAFIEFMKSKEAPK